MPRSPPKHELGEFFTGIESIEKGVAYDKRYSLKKVRFDRPQVLVFTNRMPMFRHLSEDRWQVHAVLRDYSLQKRN
eukprot:14915970-Alexandrium_andersonii.AAC.1